MQEYKVKSVNITFLCTVLISMFGWNVIELLVMGGSKIYDVITNSSGTGIKILERLGNDYFIMLILSQVLIFLPSAIFILKNKKYFFSNLKIRNLKPKTYLMLCGFGVFFIPIISFVNSISLLFTENVIADDIGGMFENHSLAASIIVVALLPCVLEELVYRGVFYNEYSRINVKKAMIMSAFLFGLLHMNFNQFLYAAVGGVIFALIVEATGSITASMVMHFMINGSSVLVSYLSMKHAGDTVATTDIESLENTEMFSGSLSFLNELSPMQQTVIMLGVIACVCAVIEYVIYTQIALSEGRYKYIKNMFKKQDDDDENKPKIVTVPLIISMVLCFVIMTIRHFAGI